MGVDINCYYCGGRLDDKEDATVAEKWFHDHPGTIWDGGRDYPEGLCHPKCDKKYMKNRARTNERKKL